MQTSRKRIIKTDYRSWRLRWEINRHFSKIFVFLLEAKFLSDHPRTLWGRKRFLLPVTYFSTNLVYRFNLRVTGITMYQNDLTVVQTCKNIKILYALVRARDFVLSKVKSHGNSIKGLFFKHGSFSNTIPISFTIKLLLLKKPCTSIEPNLSTFH